MDETHKGHDSRGRFASGNSGGPGRPRRAIETDYLAALGDALTIDAWREIVTGAITSAKIGDDKARAWLSKYALGESSISLYELARRDALDYSIDDQLSADVEIAHNAANGDYDDVMHMMGDNEPPTPLRLTLKKRIKAKQAAADETDREAAILARAARRRAKEAAAG